MGSVRSRFTSAHLIALLALFVALGGSAYAFHLGKNAVKTRNIKNGAVVESKLAGGAVTDAKIAAGAVTNSKIFDGAVTKAKIAAGAVGADSVGDVLVRSATKPLPDGGSAFITATCAPGERLIGGTGNVSAANFQDVVVTGAFPSMADAGPVGPGQSPTSWTVVANNYMGGIASPVSGSAYALCLK